jgi:hypothetical protein
MKFKLKWYEIQIEREKNSPLNCSIEWSRERGNFYSHPSLNYHRGLESSWFAAFSYFNPYLIFVVNVPEGSPSCGWGPILCFALKYLLNAEMIEDTDSVSSLKPRN